jgi:hypothetical protein
MLVYLSLIIKNKILNQDFNNYLFERLADGTCNFVIFLVNF